MTPAKKSAAGASRNPKDYCIATIGSHSALQILKGARDEGVPNLAICKRGSEGPYKSFGVADDIILVDDWSEWDKKVEPELLKRNAIIIPHGSFISYMGHKRVQDMKAMYYGTKEILEWESNRTMERVWLEDAKLLLPKVFDKPEDIDRPVIVKFHGAGGGFGYFVVRTPEQFYEVKDRKYPDDNDYTIQEYIVGVPLYAHYFYSPITGELEIMSFDKIATRYGLTQEKIQEEFSVRARLLYSLYRRKVFGFDDMRKIVNDYYRVPEQVLNAYGISAPAQKLKDI
jgi:5-formaminoimidazole-4-carboxamide-1-(beta)-D-ribofuranosyl 5'-monophosphate synthetase